MLRLGLTISMLFCTMFLSLSASSSNSINGIDTKAVHLEGGSRDVEDIFIKPVTDLKYLFENNRKWRETIKAENPNYFKDLAVRQNPKFLLIGCSDSRVSAQEILGLKLGEVFIHRNIANLVVNGDMNFLSVLQYAVEVLGVEDIIVLGHYNCGGIRAAATSELIDHGLMGHWLRNIKDVIFNNLEELSTYDDEHEKLDRIVELNTREQCLNLYRNPIVQQMQRKHSNFPRIHGMVYDMRDGLLKELKVDFNVEIEKNKEIYGVIATHNQKA